MHKLTLLLIPLILLSSCTIDWNDEKDKKIAELQKQVTNNNIELQEKCSQEAKNFFIKYRQENISKYENSNSNLEIEYPDFSNHYSKKTNKCFIAISYLSTQHHDTQGASHYGSDNLVFDVLENSMIGHLQMSDQQVIECSINDTDCKTKNDYDIVFKSLMTE